MAIGLQSPLTNLIRVLIGAIESVFITHAGRTLFSGMVLLIKATNLKECLFVPWYILAAGVLGFIVIVKTNYSISRIGIGSTVSIIQILGLL